MRRALAVLLLLGFSFPLIAPVFTSGPSEAALPACCRRDGKHHCAMAGMMMAQVPSNYRTVAEKCPFSPFAGVALMLPHALGRSAEALLSRTAKVPSAVVRDAEAGYRVSFHRARQKRGPPQLLAL